MERRNERYRYAIIYEIEYEIQKRKKEDINCVLHSPPSSTTSPLSLSSACMSRHTTTTSSSFLVRTPASASQTGEGIVGLHDPIRFAYISCGSAGAGLGTVVVVVVFFSETDEDSIPLEGVDGGV